MVIEVLKKSIIIFIITSIFVGCSNDNKNKNIISISSNERKNYEQQIDELMYEYYWRYDNSTIEFFSSIIPDDVEENKNIFEASNDIGLSMEKYSGQNSIVATLNLQHFNGDSAGRGYYYFVNNKICGAYYIPENGKNVYSFNTRNVFLNSPIFDGYETDKEIANFKEYKSFIDTNGFSDTTLSDDGSFMALSINENVINIYKYSNNNLILYKKLGFSKNIYLPISATFTEINNVNTGLAVIVGNIVDDSEGEGENNYSVSEKVIFFDENFNKTNNEIILDNINCTYIFKDEGNIGIFAGENIEYYSNQNENNIWTKINQFRMGHTANNVHITDLDGDNINEYIMTDGFDMYMYRKSVAGYINIWRTHIIIENFIGNIYSGDLNDDGVKEIYISDTTGTAIRYILTPEGLLTSNEDIKYGDNIYVSDFNNDGKDDYIKIFFGENTKQSMCIQQ